MTDPETPFGTAPCRPAGDGQALPRYARQCILAALGGPVAALPAGRGFTDAAATFVSLHLRGRLQGCIGTIQPRRPLLEDVRSNALAAAFDDPRARPLSAEDVDQLEVEVSLLSPLEPLHFADEPEALSLLRPGLDGIVLRCGLHQGTFLPQVWASLPDPAQLLAGLKLKAGLPPGFFHPDLRLERFTVQIWSEPAAPGVRGATG